jgi:hypothetical protein
MVSSDVAFEIPILKLPYYPLLFITGIFLAILLPFSSIAQYLDLPSAFLLYAAKYFLVFFSPVYYYMPLNVSYILLHFFCYM